MKNIIKTIIISSLTISLSSFAGMSNEQLKKLQKLALKQENYESQFIYGEELVNLGLDKKGLKIIQYSARNSFANNGLGYEKAQRFLGEYYLKKNPKVAAGFFYLSAKSGNFRSAYVLSNMYRLGYINGKKDYIKAYEWMKIAAKNGKFPEAWEELGKMEMIGMGTKKDESSSILSLEKAIKKNNYQAMLILGIYYKINKINDQYANALISKVAKDKNNYIANYIYNKNIIGNSDKKTNKKEDSFDLITQKGEIDKKVKGYYEEMIYTFPTIDESIKI